MKWPNIYVEDEGMKLVKYFEDYDSMMLQKPNNTFVMFENKSYHSNV